MAFPLYHVFADLAELKDGELTACDSSDPLKVQGLAIRSDGGLHVVVANLTAEPQECRIGPLRDGVVKVRSLDADSAPLAIVDPLKFRSAAQRQEVGLADSALALTLRPYSVVRIDSAG